MSHEDESEETATDSPSAEALRHNGCTLVRIAVEKVIDAPERDRRLHLRSLLRLDPQSAWQCCLSQTVAQAY